jgi:hypothetical protein
MRQLLVIFDGDFVGRLKVIEDGDTDGLPCCVVGRREAEVNGVQLFSVVTDKDKKWQEYLPLESLSYVV